MSTELCPHCGGDLSSEDAIGGDPIVKVRHELLPTAQYLRSIGMDPALDAAYIPGFPRHIAVRGPQFAPHAIGVYVLHPQKSERVLSPDAEGRVTLFRAGKRYKPRLAKLESSLLFA